MADDDLRPEYDFPELPGGVRGKYAGRMKKGDSMTPEERAKQLIVTMQDDFGVSGSYYAPCLRDCLGDHDRAVAAHIAAAIRAAVEDALLDASGTLADIAFSADLDLQGVRNKARKCYERLNAVTPPAAGPAAAPSS